MSAIGNVIVAGIRLGREPALVLAGMLARDGSDRTARILLEALTQGQQFVPLTPEDKERILGVLDHPPPTLAALRGALFDELNWQRNGLTPPARSRGIADAVARRDSGHGRVAWI